jgi:hypothetical protein
MTPMSLRASEIRFAVIASPPKAGAAIFKCHPEAKPAYVIASPPKIVLCHCEESARGRRRSNLIIISMETNYKAIAIIGVVVVALFAGGLFYVISASQNRSVALGLVQQYVATTDAVQQASLEAQIRARIGKRPIAMTSRASFDSFEQLVANARACEGYAAQVSFSPREPAIDPDQAWRYCMDHPEVLIKK